MGRTKHRSKMVGAESRPITKALVKGALQLYDASKEAVAKAGERLEDLVAEARAEMTKGDLSNNGKGPSEGPRRRTGMRPRNR